MNKPVFLSDRAYASAEKKAQENGCTSVEEYLNTLFEPEGTAISDRMLREDADLPDWVREKLEEGLASPSEPITEEEIHQLVAEGIALAQRTK
ncbi:MAG TPA: hypothetical protein VGG10_11840 [Rhizomicrobium sp.]|jgi:hypothetical protein